MHPHPDRCEMSALTLEMKNEVILLTNEPKRGLLLSNLGR
jgi:hypothetical protein